MDSVFALRSRHFIADLDNWRRTDREKYRRFRCQTFVKGKGEECLPDVNLCAQNPFGLLVGALNVVGAVNSGDVEKGNRWIKCSNVLLLVALA